MPVIPRTRSNSLERTLECAAASTLSYVNCGQMFATSLGGVALFTLQFPHPVLGYSRWQAQQPISFKELRRSTNQKFATRDLGDLFSSVPHTVPNNIS